jgi:beta-mannosidase
VHSYRPLLDGWTLDGPPLDAPVPATVPGCVHTDLLAAGLIDDPYLDGNEARLGWIGRTAWTYRTAFDWTVDAAPRVDLVCAGLDTVATVSVNGVEVGRTANMHRSYRFDVLRLLVTGRNRLMVQFGSAYDYALAVRDAVGERPNAYPEPFQYIRKMACNFGWDWGPTLVTAGIWQPIGLHAWDVARLREVRPLVTVDGGTGRVEVDAEIERATEVPLVLTATVAGRSASTVVPPEHSSARLALTVPEPALWWPIGLGEPALHELAVTLTADQSTMAASGRSGDWSEPPGAARGSDRSEQSAVKRPELEGTVDSWRRRIGFRDLRLETTGGAFTFIVNGVPVFVRGANWVPDDAFPTRVDRSRYAARLVQARDAGVNYLRVWGGGRYESDDFYDLADELGLLAGQDFLFACAAYPEEEPLAAEVAAEAHEQVVRLAPHPSLVLWNGNNENHWGWHDWDWQEPLAGRSWGEGYYEETLPAIVAALDPTRPYRPGSPYSGPGLHPNDPDHGTTHVWDVWNTHDYTHYASYRPRFVAEFGFQGPPAYATLRRAVSDEPLTPDSPGVGAHQKATGGNAKLLRGLAGHLPVPSTFDDWHWATQLNQARAVRFGVEHFRSLKPLCMGTIVWQLNDCWPVISWSAIDGDGRRKPLWYALRRAYTERLLTFQPRDGGLALVAVNDSARPWRERFTATRHDLYGTALAAATIAVDLAPGATATTLLPEEVATPADPTREMVRAGQALWFFVEDVELAYPVPEYTVDVAGPRVTVTAASFLRDVTVFADRLDPAATVDEALVTLLPGERGTFTVDGVATVDPAAFTGPPVLRCVNDLVVPPAVRSAGRYPPPPGSPPHPGRTTRHTDGP